MVIPLAAQAEVRHSIDHPKDYVDTNLIGFFNVIELCRNHQVKHFVYALSSLVYVGNNNFPFNEQDQVDKLVSLHAAAKTSNELMVHSYSHIYKLKCTGLRFSPFMAFEGGLI